MSIKLKLFLSRIKFRVTWMKWYYESFITLFYISIFLWKIANCYENIIVLYLIYTTIKGSKESKLLALIFV